MRRVCALVDSLLTGNFIIVHANALKLEIIRTLVSTLHNTFRAWLRLIYAAKDNPLAVAGDAVLVGNNFPEFGTYENGG